MVVRIRAPKRAFGDQTIEAQVEEARKIVDDRLQQGYIATIGNTLVRKATQIQDGQEVRLYPAVAGG